MTEFDAFLSYQWNSKPRINRLYEYLTEKRGLKVWIDSHEMGTTNLTDEIAKGSLIISSNLTKEIRIFFKSCDLFIKGIKSSKIFVCSITQAYSDSENCRREVEFASTLKKPMVVLMLERLEIGDLGGLGFLINPFVRINCYKYPERWMKKNFEAVYEDMAVKIGLVIPEKEKEKGMMWLCILLNSKKMSLTLS